MIIRLFLIISLFQFLVCCKNRSKLEDFLILWQDKEIKFSDGFKTKIYGKDTTCLWLWEKKYKILVYLDDDGCTSCKLKLPRWKQLIKEVDSLDLNVAFVFIASLKNYQELEFIQKENKFEYPFIYDIDRGMKKLNNIPDEFLFQTFLLDNFNKVKLVGNPAFVDDLWSVYKTVISE